MIYLVRKLPALQTLMSLMYGVTDLQYAVNADISLPPALRGAPALDFK